MQSVSPFTTVSPVSLPRHKDQRFSVSPVQRLRRRRVAGRIELAVRASAIEPRRRGSDPGEENPIRGEEEEEGEVEVGLAAELEGLEEAAMAGSDKGREPTDYDRRAHIFYESSRVFRALKDRTSSTSSSSSK